MRRTLSALAGAVLLALPAAAQAAPRATDFSLPVAPQASAASAGGEHPVLRRTLRPGRRFDVLGLRWRSARGEVHAHLRVRAGGRWKRWVEVGHAHSARGSDPVWAGGADAVQLRVEGRVRGLRVHFVRTTGAARRPARVRARAAQSQPAIVPRAQWGGDTECAPRDAPTLGQVQMAFVHHTVSANDYAPEDAAAMVLGICRFHRNSNGWDDIGYNFLVDKYGQVFEGRAGGVDQAVVGAQAQGWNSQSTGIANLGTYESVPQTDAAIDALSRLIAWKLPLHGAPVAGSVTLPSGGGSANRYPSGQPVTFPRIAGHRDGNRTSCPGAQLFAQLPRIRQLAEQRAPAPAPQGIAAPGGSLTLAAAKPLLAFPEPAQLSGTLLGADARPVAGAVVRLQILTARGFQAVASATTGPDGRYAAALPTARNRVVRALVGSVASPQLRVTVAPALTARATARRVLAGRAAVLAGSLRPKRARVVIDAARQVGPTSFRRSARAVVAVRGGRFRGAVRLARPGVYRLRVRFAGDRLNAPAQAEVFVRAVRSARSLSGGAAARAAR